MLIIRPKNAREAFSVSLLRLMLTGTLAVLLGCAGTTEDSFPANSGNPASVAQSSPYAVSSRVNAPGTSRYFATGETAVPGSEPEPTQRDDERSAPRVNPPRPLPIPWADFAEMHEPNLDANIDGQGWPESGFLAIEGDCLYLELVDFEQPFPREHRRVALSLPRGWTQYDSASGEIYIHQRSRFVYGPFASGDFVSTSGGLSLAQSDTCGDRLILRAWDIAPCAGNYTRHEIRCPDWQYSMDYQVLPSEARAHLARIPELEKLLGQLRNIEQERFAGWGIDRDGTEDAYLAWLWVIGSDPASDAARRLADEHDDVELRTGAELAYEELERALMKFNSGREFSLPLSDSSHHRYPQLELRSVVRRSYVDHRANRLEVAIDSLSISRPVASAVLTGSARAITERSEIAREELEAVIGDLLTQHLGVPVKVTHSWP